MPATTAANLAEVRAMTLWLAAHDHPVFPLRVGGKTPATPNGFKDATTDPDRIAAWWARTPYNIGLATGPARLCVIDLDAPKNGASLPPPWDREPGIRDGLDVFAALADAAGQPLPLDTRTVATPSGGLHLYYLAPRPLPSTAGRLGPMIDTRAVGGYVVAPPSRTEAGGYVTTNPAPVAPLPAWLAEALDPKLAQPAEVPTAPGAVTRMIAADAYAMAAFENELDRLLCAVEGTRNHGLNAAAYALGQFVAAGRLNGHHVRDALELAAGHIGLPEREAARTIASGMAAASRCPRIDRRHGA